jgi:hypothetical protein
VVEGRIVLDLAWMDPRGRVHLMMHSRHHGRAEEVVSGAARSGAHPA